MTTKAYIRSIQHSLEDLRAADCPTHVMRDIDAYVAEIRDLWIEYRVPVKGKTLCEVFAEEERRKAGKLGL